MRILVTGNAGFIGFHLTKRLISEGIQVLGIDNINNYYDVSLKIERLKILNELSNNDKNKYQFIKSDLKDIKELSNCFKEFKPNVVINLAAQAGVRYSMKNPKAYIDSNIIGFTNLLECAKENKIKHLIYASSSSVYGGNKIMPFIESQNVDHPISLYAATKKSNEIISHTYSHLYKIPTTGLRFFTVYGPWGRPDMALFLFTKAILKRKPIKIFNNGNMKRDFTYIDDITESIFRLIFKPPTINLEFNYLEPDPSKSWAPFQIFNIGNSNSINLMHFISEIEKKLDIKAIKEFLPMQSGDVQETFANTMKLEKFIGYKPSTPIKKGVSEFIDWYINFYNS